MLNKSDSGTPYRSIPCARSLCVALHPFWRSLNALLCDNAGPKTLYLEFAFGSQYQPLTMQLGLLASGVTLSCFVSCTLVNGLRHRVERGSSTGSLSSGSNGNFLQQIDEQDNPLSLHPKPPQDPSVHSYTVGDPDNPRMRPLSFQLKVPKTLTVTTWEPTLHANLKSTLPSILRQLSVEASQVAALASEGVPLVAEAIQAIQSGKHISYVPSDIARRGRVSNIGSWINE